jgi:cellulose synthase/poly-beta-1,6-N-acetylglucosamine synthase-like glycosyltransferase
MSLFFFLVFLLSALVVFHAYIGYPLTLLALSRLKKYTLHKEYFFPSVTHIIAAYNEEPRIKAKLENTLRIDYPPEKLQIIVASDGSTDATNAIVNEFASDRLHLLAIASHNGKEFAQKEAVAMASGEIIVFSDVSTHLKSDAIREIVANFSDNSIGCVSSTDKIIEEGESGQAGEGMYVVYEMWVRKLESRVNSLVGLSGSFFAARRELCANLSPTMDSDFNTLLSAIKAGHRGIIDPQAIGYYKNIDDPQREYLRKIRTVLRGITVFVSNLDCLNVLRYGLFSYQYFSHKLIKWLVPLFLATAFLSNLALIFFNPFFIGLLGLQTLFYFFAISPIIFKFTGYPALIRAPHFFILSNAAIAMAWVKYLKGERILSWKPSDRK